MPIQINTDIPFGNACDVDISDVDGLTTISFTADPHGGIEALWFCFRLEVSDASENALPIRLTLKHLATMLGGVPGENIRPVIRTAENDWTRLPQGDVETDATGLSQVSWQLPLLPPYADIAFCYPYGEEEVILLTKGSAENWQAEAIGMSQGAHSITRISNDYSEENGTRPGIYILARQHAGETSASWVLDGFLRRINHIAGNTPLVWVVPLANIDGVIAGDYGKDPWPQDINRAWGTPPMRRENLVIQRDIDRWRRRCRPVLTLDFHAPGGSEADGIYAFLPDPDEFPEYSAAARIVAESVTESLGATYAREKFSRIAKYASRWTDEPCLNFTRYSCRTLDIPSVSWEVPYALCHEQEMTREAYQEAGARMADGIGAWLASHG